MPSGAELRSETFKILIDTPATTPAIDFPRFADALADVVENSAPRFAVGVFGTWGSGKSTLLTAIKARLNTNRCIPIEFSAWRYEREPHLIIPLLDTIREGLVTWAQEQTRGQSSQEQKTVAALARKTAAIVGQVAGGLLSGVSVNIGKEGFATASVDLKDAVSAFNKALDNEKVKDDTGLAEIYQSLYHLAFKALQAAFREFVGAHNDRRVVVFVDDLDRCLPQGALAVLESMKLFFDQAGFVFVVGLDRSVVEWCIDQRYAEAQKSTTDPIADSETVAAVETAQRRVTGEQYIKKIFQVPFALPPLAGEQLGEYIEAICADAHANLSDHQVDFLRSRALTHLRFIAIDRQVNPREVKRYLNETTLLMKMQPQLDVDVFLTMKTLAYQPRWIRVSQGLINRGQSFIDALVAALEHQDTTLLRRLAPSLDPLPPGISEYLGADDGIGTAGPGNVLLKVGAIAPYLAITETTRSTDGLTLQSARVQLAALMDSIDAQKATEEEPDFKTLMQATQTVQSLAMESLAGDAPVSATQRGVLIALDRLNRHVTSGEEDLGSLDYTYEEDGLFPETKRRRNAWLDDATRLASEALDAASF